MVTFSLISSSRMSQLITAPCLRRFNSSPTGWFLYSDYFGEIGI